MAIRRVGVVGCGLMGGGIAQTCAQSGYEVVVREVNQEFLDKGLARIYGTWNTMATKGKITSGQVDENRSRLHGSIRHVWQEKWQRLLRLPVNERGKLYLKLPSVSS